MTSKSTTALKPDTIFNPPAGPWMPPSSNGHGHSENGSPQGGWSKLSSFKSSFKSSSSGNTGSNPDSPSVGVSLQNLGAATGNALQNFGAAVGTVVIKGKAGITDWANQGNDLLRVPKQNKWVLDPRTSQFVKYWDCVSVVALVYTALMTPFVVAFVNSFGTELFVNDVGEYAYEMGKQEMPDGLTHWWAIGRVLDAIFLFDLVLQFFLAYETPDGNLIKRQDLIIRHYLRTWFFMDVLSQLPLIFEIYHDTIHASKPPQVDLVRIVRVFRLIKLVRLVRAARVIKRWQARVTIPHATLRLTYCLGQVVLFAHWEACAMMLVASFNGNPTSTFLGDLQYCREGPVNVTSSDGVHLADGMFCRGRFEIYLACTSWALLVITGTGGADAYPRVQDATETALVTFLVLASAVVWTNVLATFCDIVTNADPVSTKFHQDMERMSDYMDKIEVPEDLRMRVRMYLYQSCWEQINIEDKGTTELLSPTLRYDLVCASPSFQWLWNIFILRDCEPEFLVLLPRSMVPRVFAPQELPEDGRFYVLNKGVAIHDGILFTSGKAWGESMLVANPELRKPQFARAMTYIETFSIDRNTIYEVAMPFPKSEKILIRRALIMALAAYMENERAKEWAASHGEMKKTSQNLGTSAATCHTMGTTLRRTMTLTGKLHEVSKVRDVIHRDLVKFHKFRQGSDREVSRRSTASTASERSQAAGLAYQVDAMDQLIDEIERKLKNMHDWQAGVEASQANFSKTHHQSMSTMLELHQSMSSKVKLLLQRRGADFRK